MRRRDLIALAGAALVPADPRGVFAQSAMRTVGYLGAGSPDKVPDVLAGVRGGLAERGYVEGRNLTFEYRWAQYQMERLPELAADLASRQLDLIIMFAIPQSVVDISRKVPVVFFTGVDPVKVGMVASLNNPGGNLTGVAVLNIELSAKRLEFLTELVPSAATVAYLGSPFSTELEKAPLRSAAQALGLGLLELSARSVDEFEPAFTRMIQERAGALLVGNDAVLQRNSDRIAALAAQHRIPAIYVSRISAQAGGLMSYGTRYADAYRIIGNYAGRILSGEKPAELPVQQLSKVELVINLTAARALGLDVPATLLARADEVIE